MKEVGHGEEVEGLYVVADRACLGLVSTEQCADDVLRSCDLRPA